MCPVFAQYGPNGAQYYSAGMIGEYWVLLGEHWALFGEYWAPLGEGFRVLGLVVIMGAVSCFVSCFIDQFALKIFLSPAKSPVQSMVQSRVHGPGFTPAPSVISNGHASSMHTLWLLLTHATFLQSH